MPDSAKKMPNGLKKHFLCLMLALICVIVFNHRFSHTLTQPRDRQIKVKRHPVVLVNAAVNTNSRGIPQLASRKKTDAAVLRRYEPLIVHTNQVSDSTALLFIFSSQFGYFPLTRILIRRLVTVDGLVVIFIYVQTG